jgi:hypothetical protein
MAATHSFALGAPVSQQSSSWYHIDPRQYRTQPDTKGGWIRDKLRSLALETVWEVMERERNEESEYYLWASNKEWEVVWWLSTNGLSKASIDQFLKLDYVSFFLPN